MGNEKITGDMSMIDVMVVMSESNPAALSVLMGMTEDQIGFGNILLLDTLDIRGAKLWALYSDSCGRNKEKFNRTLMALRYGVYSQEEIQANLGLCNVLPFLDDSIHMDGIEELGPTSPNWQEYLIANRELVVPKIYKKVEEETSDTKSQKI